MNFFSASRMRASGGTHEGSRRGWILPGEVPGEGLSARERMIF